MGWKQPECCEDVVKLLVSQMFIKSLIREEYDDRVTYDIPQQSVKSLSDILDSLENAKKSMTGFEEYIFSQTTLERVFISFAKDSERIRNNYFNPLLNIL